MSKYTFEEILVRDGQLVYSNVGDSMLPLIRQGRDLLVIVPVKGRLKKYDIPLYKRDSGQSSAGSRNCRSQHLKISSSIV